MPGASSGSGQPAGPSAVDLLQAAFERRDRDELEVLAGAGVALEIRDPSGRTVLMRVAEAGDVETLQWILAAGAMVDRTLDDGRTALMLAAAAGRGEVVEALLAAGAEVSRRDDGGADAVAWARRGGWVALADRLNAERSAEEDASTADTTIPHPIAATPISPPTPPPARVATAPPRQDSGAAAAPSPQPPEATHPVLPGPRSGGGARPSALALLRGLGDPSCDDESLLVAAPPGPVAETLATTIGASVWRRHAHGLDIVTTPCCFLVFRFRGQRWTVVRPAHEAVEGPDPETAPKSGEALEVLARRLSRRLPAAVIVADHRPSVGCFRYALFDRGRWREGFADHQRARWPRWPASFADDAEEGARMPRRGSVSSDRHRGGLSGGLSEGLSDSDRGRHRDQHSDRQHDALSDDPSRAMHHLLHRHQAYAPSWGRLEGTHHRLEIAGLSAEDFERLDFIARD